MTITFKSETINYGKKCDITYLVDKSLEDDIKKELKLMLVEGVDVKESVQI